MKAMIFYKDRLATRRPEKVELESHNSRSTLMMVSARNVTAEKYGLAQRRMDLSYVARGFPIRQVACHINIVG